MSDIEKKEAAGFMSSEPEPLALKRAIRKLDLIFLPCLTTIYWLNFLDRSNIGNAKAANLLEDLGISSKQYSIALTVTYVPYIIAELPLTLAIRKVGPNILIPTLVVLWGIVSLFQGFVHNYAGLLAARFFLGCTEGAIVPASITYLSTFYRRGDLAKRVAFYFSATSLAGAFSGLLAAAILNMHGVGGKPGWAWIFILEGLFTVVLGSTFYFILPRTPGSAWWLSEEESVALVAALDRDRPQAEDHQPLTIKACVAALKAPQVWFMVFQFFSSGVTLYSGAFFSPTIVQTLGYKGTKIQLYSVPPYVVSTFVAFGCCYLSDKWNHRGGFVIFAAVLSIVGYAMFLGSTDKHVLYAALFFQIMGAYTVAPLQSTWNANNLAPFFRRVTGLTLGFITTNAGGILSTWLFPAKDAASHFRRGTSVLLGLSAAIILWSVLNMLYLSRENKKRKAAGGFEEGLVETNPELGDRSIHFKYIL